MSAFSLAVKRLQSEYHELLERPIHGVLAHPMDNNVYQWHFAIAGPPDSPFEGGVYHGELIFNDDYPMKPPAIYFTTPNGLFRCDSDLCLSFADDRSQGWSSANSVTSILGALWFAFNNPREYLSPFTSTEDIKDAKTQQDLAEKSWEFNLKDRTFCKYFPHLSKVMNDESGENSNKLDK